jgi:lipid II:glycine glycyltransferase (peptidoglycan interpeptide bridge formation enzyme)
MIAPTAEPSRWRAWDRFVTSQPTPGFMQTSAWARVRERVGYEHFAITVKDGRCVVGGALVGKWTFAPGRCFYYVQDGPILPPQPQAAEQVYDALMAGVDTHRRSERQSVSHLRIEPRWTTLPDFVKGFNDVPPIDGYTEPRTTLRIDLRADDEQILAQMKPKGRYNVRVAARHGVDVVRDDSEQGLLDFIRIQRRTAHRQGLEVKPPRYFRALFDEFSSRRAMGLYFAQYRGRRLATALVVFCGPMATYFYGGSLELHRRVMAPYALHFEIMRAARQLGCEWYDFWGIAAANAGPHKWDGISTFKRKFGGEEVALVPSLDRVFDARAYSAYVSAERRATREARR